MKVADVMPTDVQTVDPEVLLDEAAALPRAAADACRGNRRRRPLVATALAPPISPARR